MDGQSFKRFVGGLRAARVAAWLGGLLLIACGAGSGTQSREHARGSSSVGGAVVSTVDGHPITVAQVQELLVRGAGLSPQEALRRLQQERLLMLEAERRGLAERSEVTLVAEQARAQALLASLSETAVVTDEEVRAAYDKALRRFVKLEQRASVHVLARLPEKPTPEAEAAAKALATELIGPLEQAQDLDAFIAQLQAVQRPGVEIIAQHVPAIDRKAAFAQPFLDALFALPAPGTHRAPVRTRFGWHAVRVTEIVPASETPYAEAAAILRKELLAARRTQLVQELLETARKDHGVQISKTAAQTLAQFEL